jgi:hypothetical protein
LSRIKLRPALIPGAILALAVLVRLVTAWPLRQPGYTDAYYYAVGARQLYSGQGFEEPVIWNYLDPPEEVPHPGYEYWMPLTAMLGWAGMLSLGDSFRAVQIPFVLVSALLPLVTYGIAWDLASRWSQSAHAPWKHATLAGLLAVFPGYYAHVLVLPDNFAPFALAGSICLWAAGRGLHSGRAGWFGLAGIAAGLGHLARADGALLAAVALAAAVWHGREARRKARYEPAGAGWARALAASLVLVIGGYLLVMGPWFARNWQVSGAPLSGAGTRTLFLTTYDDVFAYEQAPTLESYLAWGWSAILESKGQALLLNLQRLWVETLLIVLLPFAALGAWRLRRQRLLWPFFLYLPTLFLLMTLLFTFPGMRGGLYHSGAALLPFFFAVSGPGLEVTLRWTARRLRGWHARRAWSVFSAGLVALALFLTVFALWQAGALNGDWNERSSGYGEIGLWLAGRGEGEAVVMVGDAPGFSWHTGNLAVAVPDDPPETILAVADRYGARYLVLDHTRPRTTDALYAGETTHPRLIHRFSAGADEHRYEVYEVEP